MERIAAEGTLVQIRIEGLLGGHSGTDIDKERQNANILMARLVEHLMKNTDGKLVTFAGGTKDNAITRECEASLVYAEKAEAEKAEKLACELAETFSEEISSFEPGLWMRGFCGRGTERICPERRGCKSICKRDPSCSERSIQT